MSDPTKRPLSIAVFGPPGSGKSFSVDVLINSAKPENVDIENITINMTQYSDWQTVKNTIIDFIRKDNKNQIPVLFFDEFDSSLDGIELGWLKNFLPIMEDWSQFVKNNFQQIKKIRNPIFIFAGGTSHNYADFSREDDSISDADKLKFLLAKGPDFVSRLCGHINILGVNLVDDEDDSYVIRRAILLRQYLAAEQKDGNDDVMEPALVKTLLNISSFKHGARSMRAIINMCGKIGGNGGKILSSTLPILPQLNMHINGKEFLEMIENNRKK